MKDEEALVALIKIIEELFDEPIEVSAGTQLIGAEASVDSMKLVEICLALEDLGEQLGFEFDWTSDAAMSKSQSIFRDVGSLAEEFVSQARG